MIAPTDMSSPLSPDMITAAWPIDASVRIDVVIKILEILFIDRKPLLRHCPRIKRATVPIIAGRYGLLSFFSVFISFLL